MNILDNISKNYKIHTYYPTASQNEIENLQNLSAIILPEDYLKVVPSKDLEILVKNKMYIRIWKAKDVIELNNDYNFLTELPGSLAIGDNEGDIAIVYMNGNVGFGLYYIDYSIMNIINAIYLAPSLTKLLLDDYGIDVLLSPYNDMP